MEVAVKNLAALVRKTPITILDHHILRDEAWRDKMKPAFDAAERMGNKILTAAEYLGEKNRLLEARRRNLYEDEPPSREFIEWTRIQPSERRVIEPPI
jgi:predicted metallo-beta-lactamase superfamily hydrolase